MSCFVDSVLFLFHIVRVHFYAAHALFSAINFVRPPKVSQHVNALHLEKQRGWLREWYSTDALPANHGRIHLLSDLSRNTSGETFGITKAVQGLLYQIEASGLSVCMYNLNIFTVCPCIGGKIGGSPFSSGENILSFKSTIIGEKFL